ncbi:MAG: hypothetical protein IAE94_09290 [Chthoniobacterales bacterium]|nr:hypothetical protein [Chthoniobacterales bacterium]
MRFVLSEPVQPAEEEWRFVEDLKTPLWESLRWQRKPLRHGEVSLRGGVCVQSSFPDPGGVLETAFDDLRQFFTAGRISCKGEYSIHVRPGETEALEAYRLEVRRDGCTIVAGDSEGVRRGLFFLQDEILRTGGPFLPLGVTARKPQIRTRLSRCFFGPINRPPKKRDELADDVDYYPDAYLNRLAHESVNALWLTVNFRDLCPSRFFPDHGRDSGRRLAKLRRVVQKCARHGIRIYAFCIEPKGFGNVPEYLNSQEDLARHPELGGHRQGDTTFFCPSSPEAQEYLETSAYHLFSQVPGLGGLMGINLGERPTHCRSAMLWDFSENNCPRCSKREPWQTFHDTLSPLRRGMNRANPEAELISWLYVPYIPDRSERRIAEAEKMIRQVAAHFPENVTFQYNFESMGTLEQLGKTRRVRDYSLAYVGPSCIFANCAKALKTRGARLSAKLQVGCSHEVATVPFVPAPGNLFRKYRTMHELGVSGAMHSWYFGSYPSLMTKAAGELSFAPFPQTEKAFLQRLAEIGWGEDGSVVAEAWRLFSKAYRYFPANLAFAWYGPVHDAVVWPLHLNPVNTPMAPSWLLGYPPSGDRMGECVGFEHTLGEAISLCEKMLRTWSAGILLLEPLLNKYRRQKDRVWEIGVAQAMHIQIRSAVNVLKFYAERERLYSRCSPKAREKSFAKLEALVVAEIENSTKLEKLSRADSRLGFHSEAEGYKYFPAKLRWRKRLLQSLLRKDFPEAKRRMKKGCLSAFEPRAGETTYECARKMQGSGKRKWNDPAVCHLAPNGGQNMEGWETCWQSAHDGRNLFFRIKCKVPPSAISQQQSQNFADSDFVRISIEPRRFGATRDFYIGRFGARFLDNKEVLLDRRWKTRVLRRTDGWIALATIPLECLDQFPSALLRLNVERTAPGLGNISWIPRRQTKYRLIHGDLAPSDLGWFRRNCC